MDPIRDDEVFRPMTPEEKAFCDKMAESFTDEMAEEYARIEGPFYPIEQVIAEMDEIGRRRWGDAAKG